MGWNEYFLQIAKTVASKSKDPKRQVGSIIVDRTNRIVSTGFNGMPPLYPDDEVDWTNREFVREYIVHAELNAILFAHRSLEGCSLYSTLSPCLNCLKSIAAVGITDVYYLEGYKDIDLSAWYADKVKIKLHKIIE